MNYLAARRDIHGLTCELDDSGLAVVQPHSGDGDAHRAALPLIHEPTAFVPTRARRRPAAHWPPLRVAVYFGTASASSLRHGKAPRRGAPDRRTMPAGGQSTFEAAEVAPFCLG